MGEKLCNFIFRIFFPSHSILLLLICFLEYFFCYFFLFFRVLIPNFATILVLKNDLLRIKRNMEMI